MRTAFERGAIMKTRWVVLPLALVVLGLIALAAADVAKAGKPASPLVVRRT